MGLLNFLARSLAPEREMDRVEREIDLAKERAQRDPENAETWKQLGDLHLRIGLVGSASQAYQNAVSLFLQRKDQEEAHEIFRKLILFNFFDLPKFERIFLEQGLQAQVIGLYHETAEQMRPTDESYARDIFRRILSIDPMHQAARHMLGGEEMPPASRDVRPASFTIPQTKLLSYLPLAMDNEQAALPGPGPESTVRDEKPPVQTQEAITESRCKDGDIDQLIRESMQQQREMLELMETLLRRAMDDSSAAGGDPDKS